MEQNNNNHTNSNINNNSNYPRRGFSRDFNNLDKKVESLINNNKNRKDKKSMEKNNSFDTNK
ncbi:hypothetical protein Catovirus_2_91 [Catovirus CTV1]|uniref:Uncharacterized protein n=1 Tax=Catovirus CTV1 TaxID=1977631 RepID=A0A1V0SBQ9_9VIRU|nr:hypothetical protein Catovirus_2_91 [Catovirus CTV1]